MAINIIETAPDAEVLTALMQPENYAIVPPTTPEGLVQTRCGDRRLAYMGGVGLWGAALELGVARMIAGDTKTILGALSDPHTTIQRAVHNNTCAADAGVPDFVERTLTDPRAVALTGILTDRLGEARGVPGAEWKAFVSRHSGRMDDITDRMLGSLRAEHQPGAALGLVAQHQDGVIIDTPDVIAPPRAVVIDTSAQGVLRAGVTDGTLYHHNGNIVHASDDTPPEIAIAAQRWVGSVAMTVATAHGLPLYLASDTGRGRRLERVEFT